MSIAYTAYCIIPRSTVSCSQPVSSLGWPCCTQFCIFVQLRVNQWIESPLPSRLPPELNSSRLTASLYFSNLARSWPPSASPNLLDHGLQVHLQTRLIAASKCSSKLAWSWHPYASLNSLDHGLAVSLWVHSIVIFGCTSKLGKIECVFCLSLSPSPLFLYLRMYMYRAT